MKINWKVRMRHKQFWVAIISAVVLLANQIASLFGYDITLVSANIQQVLESILLILALLGIIIDPTTVGLSDSSQAMVYEKPRDDAHKDYKSVEKGGEKQQETKNEIQNEKKLK